mgnify:CR=1 FL=1
MSSRERSRRLKLELDKVTENAANFSLKASSTTKKPRENSNVHAHSAVSTRTPPRPRGLRRVGSYDSVQMETNMRYQNHVAGRSDALHRKRSNSFDNLSPVAEKGGKSPFVDTDLPRVARVSDTSKYAYRDYSTHSTSLEPRRGTFDSSNRTNGKSSHGKIPKRTNSFSQDNGNSRSQMSRKESASKKDMELAKKRFRDKRRTSKSEMEQQFELGLESQYVLPLTWSKAESAIERGDTIVVNPVYYNANQAPPGPTFTDSYIRCCAYQESTFEAPSPIFDWLYLGDRHDARDRSTFEDLGISWVINATTDIANFFEHETINGRPMRYMNVNLNDAEGVDLMRHFADTNRFLMKCKRSGGKALVHCRAGMSRSTSIMCAFLMFNETWRLTDALDYCRKKRFICDPNIDFRLQLALYEIYLFGKSSVKARLGAKEWDSYRLRSLLSKPGIETSYGFTPPPCVIS